MTQEILRTELIRIKALIGTTVLLARHPAGPSTSSRPKQSSAVWHGNLKPSYLYSHPGPVHPVRAVGPWRHQPAHRAAISDVPVIRRYLGALIETSMPTIALALHIDSMGPVEALGFVVPLAYFIFIILSTLRLDFWLSTFTGFVAAAELLCMAMFYHRVGSSDPPPELFYHGARSLILLIGGMLAGAVGVQLRRQFEASILAATARDRITNLFGQHVSPQVVERLMAEGTSARAATSAASP